MSQNATPLKLEDVAELGRYLITKHKRSGIDVSLSILYAVADNKNEAMTDGRLDSVYVQDYFKSFL
jgi:hypothetical protein